MEVSILVHSKTGNTRKFADSISARLSALGHKVSLTQLQTTVPINGGSVRQPMDIRFVNLPDITTADLILFGGPVWAFSPSPVIDAAMKQLGSLQGKKAMSFCTMGFPLKGMGGKGSLRWMDRRLKELGADVLPGSICCQMMHKLDEEIAKETERIAAMVNTL